MLPPSPTASVPTVRQTLALLHPRALSALAADSDREDVQERVRDAIRAGSVRARPWPGDPRRVKIAPMAPIECE